MGLFTNNHKAKVASGIDANGNLTYENINYALKKDANKANAGTYQTQLEWAQHQYDNWYNSPEHQKELLLAAGYNPNIYQNQGATSDSVTSRPEAVDGSSPLDNIAQMAGAASDLGSVYNNVYNAAQSRQLQREGLDLERSKIALQREQVDIQRQDLERKNKETNANIELLGKKCGETDENIKLLQKKQDEVDENIGQIKALTDLAREKGLTQKQITKQLEIDNGFRKSMNSGYLEELWHRLEANDWQRRIMEEQWVSLLLDNGEHEMRLGVPSFRANGKTFYRENNLPLTILQRTADGMQVNIDLNKKNLDLVGQKNVRDWIGLVFNASAQMTQGVATGVGMLKTLKGLGAGAASGARSSLNSVAPFVTPPGTDLMLNPQNHGTYNPVYY